MPWLDMQLFATFPYLGFPALPPELLQKYEEILHICQRFCGLSNLRVGNQIASPTLSIFNQYYAHLRGLAPILLARRPWHALPRPFMFLPIRLLQ